jgi:hypothetical protein
MSENPLRQIQVHTQRALAAADQIDQQLETEASALVVGRGRAFLAAVEALIDGLRPPVPVPVPLPALPPPEPPKEVVAPPAEVIAIGDTVQLPDGHRGVVRYRSENAVEGTCLHVMTQFGLLRTLPAKCTKVQR